MNQCQDYFNCDPISRYHLKFDQAATAKHVIRLAGTAAKRMKKLGARQSQKNVSTCFNNPTTFLWGAGIRIQSYQSFSMFQQPSRNFRLSILWDAGIYKFHLINQHPVGVQDLAVDRLARYKKSSTGRRGSNAARDFHRYVHRHGKALAVEISTSRIPIRKKVKTTHGKRRTKTREVDHAVINLSSWMRLILEKYPKFLLGGHCPFQGCDPYLDMFGSFWDNFVHIQGDHPVHAKSREDNNKRHCIPFAVHGDEGRGLSKVPVLVMSFQALIPFTGPNELNCSRFPDFKG